ncbi:hypothetical protein [Runella sp.]|uniref:hypothetical protein n=1 Tax=Runella sp. TaxID=1960881 RepID=UPI0030170BD5
MAKIIRQISTPRPEASAESSMDNKSDMLPVSPIFSTEALAEWLCKMGEEEAWNDLRRTAAWQSPYSQANLPCSQWLEGHIKSLFPYEFAEKLWQNIQTQQQLYKQELQELQRANQRLLAERDEFNQKLWRVQDELNNKEAETIRLQRLNKASISIIEILPYWFGSGDLQSEAIQSILSEDIQNPDVQLVPFAAELSKQWQRLQSLLAKLPQDDDEAMNAIYNQLTYLLQKLSGIYIPQRRAILDVMARACSSHSEKYIFVSPEESTRVDTSIHQALGLGGERVKEGKSFAVIRRDTRQTVRFAEIEVM